MLKRDALRCGIYDSQVNQRNKSRTPERQVKRYELELYHTDGGVSYIDGVAYPVRKGMLLCALPGQVRHSQLPIRSSYIWVEPQESVGEILKSLPTCTYIDDPQTFDALMRGFTQLHSSLVGTDPEPEATVNCSCYFFEILRLCLQQSRGGDQRPVAGRLIREAYQYMDKHFCESCSLKQIADHVHVSANHLHTVFLRSEGYTPYEYVTKKRVDRAKTLMFIGEGSLAQIALETGFCSQSHFCAAFKKATGQTPAQYRKQIFDMK